MDGHAVTIQYKEHMVRVAIATILWTLKGDFLMATDQCQTFSVFVPVVSGACIATAGVFTATTYTCTGTATCTAGTPTCAVIGVTASPTTGYYNFMVAVTVPYTVNCNGAPIGTGTMNGTATAILPIPSGIPVTIDTGYCVAYRPTCTVTQLGDVVTISGQVCVEIKSLAMGQLDVLTLGLTTILPCSPLATCPEPGLTPFPPLPAA
jgi:hypothetical protein